MGRLFEGFEILCTDYDHMLEKRGDIIQGRTLSKEILRYLFSSSRIEQLFKTKYISRFLNGFLFYPHPYLSEKWLTLTMYI